MSRNVEDNFNLAANFIQSNHHKFTKNDLLKFYAFYKLSTVGVAVPTKRPSFFKMQERAKFDAWAAVGSMHQETAMTIYAEMLTKLEPNWTSEISQEIKDAGGSFGVSVSRPKVEEILDSEKSIEDFIREGNVIKLEELLRKMDTNDLNSLDENGLGLVHWASDRGNVEVLKAILSTTGVNVDLQDREGQTPLHYAASCSHKDAVKILLHFGAKKEIVDNEGTTSRDAADDNEIKSLLS